MLPRSNARAFVLGDYDLVRPLGLAGIGCVAVAEQGNPVTRSRFVKATLHRSWEDFSENQEALLATLLDFARSERERPVLYYEEDEQLLFVSRHRERLSEGFRFVVAERVLVEDLVDKARFKVLAEKAELRLPKSRQVRPSAASVPQKLELAFPVIVKPLMRRKSWNILFGAKALRVDSVAELAPLWGRLAELDIDILIQELVPGPETRMESYHAYVRESGEVAAEFTGRKIRTFPVSYGHSTALTISDEADVRALGREILTRLGIRGVVKVDLKRAPDGSLYLLEINPRFSLWHHLGAVAGLNLPAMVHADLTGHAGSSHTGLRAGACWCRMSTDFKAAKDSGIPFAKWLPWAMRCEAKSPLAWDDPLPFFSGALRHGWSHFGPEPRAQQEARAH